MEKIPLIAGYSYMLLEHTDFLPLFKEHRHEVFGDTFTLRARDYAYSSEELDRLESLKENLGQPLGNHFAIYQNDKFVGWSTGWQATHSAYNMLNTGILKEHQDKGIYSALLKVIIDKVRSQGFQTIVSRHNATNNRVIVPKLKAGFVITGMELSDGFGTLVTLSYFMNEKRKEAIDMRSGLRKPGKEMLEQIGVCY